jgi:hypothetical protein
MTALDHHHSAVLVRKVDSSPYAVSGSLAIIVGVSLSLWMLAGFVLYEAF